MVTYDTEENDRHWMTAKTLDSLAATVNFKRHRLVVVDNGSTDQRTGFLLSDGQDLVPFTLIRNPKNIGTARAINRGWQLRHTWEHAVKMDNDVVIHQVGWLDQIEEVFNRDPKIGICGLKRKDLMETPWQPNEWFRSKLCMLPHVDGQRWIIVEEVNHVMGTCQAYNSLLLDKIGYLEQGSSLYGFDDSLAAVRSQLAGFKNVFLPHIEIEHIDPGGTAFTQQKLDIAGKNIPAYQAAKKAYMDGTRPLYCGPEGRPW